MADVLTDVITGMVVQYTQIDGRDEACNKLKKRCFIDLASRANSSSVLEVSSTWGTITKHYLLYPPEIRHRHHTTSSVPQGIYLRYLT